MIIAEFNLWWLLIQEPGLTWKPVWYFIPGKFHPVILVSWGWSLGHFLQHYPPVLGHQTSDLFCASLLEALIGLLIGHCLSAGSAVWFGSYSPATGRQQRLCFCVCWMNNIRTQTTTQYDTNVWWELSWMDFFACTMSFFLKLWWLFSQRT